MSLTCKEILDTVLAESGLPVNAQYFGGNDLTLNAILNRSVKSLGQEDFSLLRSEGLITMTTDTEYDLPSDLRYIIPDTINIQDDERFISFPTDDATWWYFKSQSSQSGIRHKARIANGKLQILNPENGSVLIFEYLTKNVISSSGSITPDKERFSADTDTFLLDDEMLILETKWRYKREKGIEGWQSDAQDYARYKRIHQSKEAGSGTICMAGGGGEVIKEPYTDLYI